MSARGFASTPKPPYYAVIFTNQRTEGDHGYGETADRMVELARQQPGFLGIESVRGADGCAIRDAHHALRVAKMERAYGMPAKA